MQNSNINGQLELIMGKSSVGINYLNPEKLRVDESNSTHDWQLSLCNNKNILLQQINFYNNN